MSTAPIRHSTWPRVTLCCYALEDDPQFAAALDRASRQRYPGLEILATQFGPNRPAKTPVDALNELCGQAQGEYVLFFHPGENLADDFLMHAVTALKSQANPPDFMYGTLRKTHDQPSLHTTDYEVEIPVAYTDRNEFRELLRGPHFALGSCIIRRGIFSTQGEFRNEYGNQFAWEFFLRITGAGARGGFTPFASVTETEPLAHAELVEPLEATLRATLQIYEEQVTLEQWPQLSGAERALEQKCETMQRQLAEIAVLKNQPALHLSLARLRERVRFFNETSEPVNESQRPTISIILTTTGERLLEFERALQSALAQTFTKVEIVIVQNGGPGLLPWVTQIADDERIRFFYLPQRIGAAAARFSGVRLANGHYISYLDEDNVFHPTHLARLLARLEISNADLAYTGADLYVHQGANVAPLIVEQAYSSVNAHLIVSRVPAMCLNAVVHRAKLIEDSGFIDLAIPVLDDWFYLLCILSGQKLTAPLPGASVDVHLGAPPRESELGRVTVNHYLLAYDTICARVPLNNTKHLRERSEHRERIVGFANDWEQRLENVEAFTELVKTLIGYVQVAEKSPTSSQSDLLQRA